MAKFKVRKTAMKPNRVPVKPVYNMGTRLSPSWYSTQNKNVGTDSPQLPENEI